MVFKLIKFHTCLQVACYLEALQKDFVAVLPTGAGKTRIASMVLKKMRMLNTNRKRICPTKTGPKIVSLFYVS
jgi:ERCC4-related helicase